MRLSSSSSIRLTTGGSLRIFPEGSSSYFGGGLHFSAEWPYRQVGTSYEPSLPALSSIRSPPLDDAVRRLPGAADDRSRRDDRERRAAIDPARPPLHSDHAHLGR